MSERILKALMQMFAIIARVDGITNSGREIVQSFLKEQLNAELVEQYLKVFDEFLEAHHQISKKKDGAAKRTSVGSVKVLKICTQINAELTQKQKVVVLIRLLEFINSNNEVSEQEIEFVTTVAETFNIEEAEFKRLRDFVQNTVDIAPDNEYVLVVDNNQTNPVPSSKHIYSEGISGQIRILHIPSVGMYVFRYYGSAELYANGQGVNNKTVQIFTPGSSIRSSKVLPIYYSDVVSSFLSDKTKDKITFVASNLDYKFKNGKLGLRGVNLGEDAGKLIGIMGGSGAGKSTLLNVLNGTETPSAGAITINGVNIFTEKHKIEGVIGHVPQDDLLIEELTVYENLFYNAKLCFGGMPDDQITKRVNDLLSSIGLIETSDLKVGSPLEKTISGGQRKRLNIALELIREPSVLFVDEPTSGLSSRDSENIMDLLKELSLKGKLIFVVIHQPSSDIFKMFDKLMILDVGGYPIYYGNPVDAIIYFKKIVAHANSDESECPSCGNVNPEQIFNIIESKVLDEFGNQTTNRKVSPVEWNKNYIEKIEQKIEGVGSNTNVPQSTFKIPNKIKQYTIFITRDVKAKLTNKQYMSISLLESPVLAFILAYLVKYYNTDVSNKIGYFFFENENTPAYLFMSVVVALFVGLTVSAEEIIKDRKILKRESFLNLSRASYLYSKITIMFTLSAIQTLTFILVGNTVLGIKGELMNYWLVLFSTSCFANMLGLNISASFNSAVTIYILIPFLIIPQLLLSGVIVKFDKLNPVLTSQTKVPFAGEVMTSRWAYEALAVNQFKNNKYERQFFVYDKQMAIAEFKKDYWISNLRGKVDKCETSMKVSPGSPELVEDLALMRNEISKENKSNKDLDFPAVEKITAESYTPAIANQLRDYFNNLNKYYIRKYNQASTKREKIISKRTKTPEEKEIFLKEKNDYVNESMSDLLRNSNELKKITEKDGQLIQRANPIFLDPTDNYGRAHFFAPRKKLLGRYYDTFWFNISVIWSMSLLLGITLYFDVLKKLINSLENLLTGFSKKAA